MAGVPKSTHEMLVLPSLQMGEPTGAIPPAFRGAKTRQNGASSTSTVCCHQRRVAVSRRRSLPGWGFTKWALWCLVVKGSWCGPLGGAAVLLHVGGRVCHFRPC